MSVLLGAQSRARRAPNPRTGLRLTAAAAVIALAVGLAAAPVSARSAPAAPTNLVSTSVAHDSVALSWDDPGDASITGYVILRRDIVNQPPGDFDVIEDDTTSAATSYVDVGVAPSTRYAYGSGRATPRARRRDPTT